MKNILIKGAPGTGKTLLSRAMAYYVGHCGEPVERVFSKDILADWNLIETYIESDHVEYIQVHASMTYEDIVYGIEVDAAGTPSMAYVEKRVKKICDRAKGGKDKYFIIFDDIERTHASSLLGNLLYAMEYRNEPVALCDGNTLVIPENVVIIATECGDLYGTPMEYALRRRFDYEKELTSSGQVLEGYYNGFLTPGTKKIVLDIFEAVRNFISKFFYEENVSQKEKYIPGHGMYMVPRKGTENDILWNIRQKFMYQVYPYMEDLARGGILAPSDMELEDFRDTIGSMLNVGAPSKVSTGSVTKIFIGTGKKIAPFSQTDSKNYYANTVLPGNCKEHRAIIENICDAILTNQVLPIEKAMSDILLNTNVVRFEHRTKSGIYAAFLVEDKQNSNYGYLTTVSTNIRSYYSSNPCRTGRWASYNDAPAYKVTYSNGKTITYIPLNAFRNAGFDTSNPVIHAEENTASIYCALYDLVKAYLTTCETELARRASGDSGYVDVSRLARLEKEYWELVNTQARGLSGAERKLVCLGTAASKLQLLWNDAGAMISVDEAKFNGLASGMVINSVRNYEGLYNITGTVKNIELKGAAAMVNLNDYQKVMESIGVHQMVFQGPPGTSKTFASKKFVLEQLKPASRVFSPGANVTQDLISAELADFKLTAADYENPLASSKINTGGWDIVQFHPSYSYEDFIRGIEVRPMGGVPTYKTTNRLLGRIAEFAKMAEKATAHGATAPRFYLIIDEINRANLATVFGELIYGLEYRDSKVSTPYEVEDKLSGVSGAKTNDIVLGKNLFLIGTMNTADKSIDPIDYAIRRRFLFIDSPAQREAVLSRYQAVKGGAAGDEASIELFLFDAVGTLFEGNRFFNEEYQRSDVRIGHTYFLRSSASDYLDEMIERFVFQIVPILREYVKDGILDSREDLKSLEHSEGDVSSAAPADRVRLMGENIMLYVRHFGEENGSRTAVIDNAYIANAIEKICLALCY